MYDGEHAENFRCFSAHASKERYVKKKKKKKKAKGKAENYYLSLSLEDMNGAGPYASKRIVKLFKTWNAHVISSKFLQQPYHHSPLTHPFPLTSILRPKPQQQQPTPP
jgi:hypothetical protein